MATTFTKLRNGTWGIRIPAAKNQGDIGTFEVTKKNGETKVVRAKVLWSGNGISLAAILSTESETRRHVGHDVEAREDARIRRYGSRTEMIDL